MKPWKLEVTWICHDAYGDPVEVYLHVMGEHERRLGRFDTKEAAIAYAHKWAADRGFEVGPVVEPSNRVILHPRPIDIDTDTTDEPNDSGVESTQEVD